MNCSFRIAGAAVLVSILSSAIHAGPPHHGGLPPGLQKKLERGERLPPGWSRRAAVYGYGYGETGYGQDAFAESYSDQYEPEYVEDTVYRMIKDARDLINIFPQ